MNPDRNNWKTNKKQTKNKKMISNRCETLVVSRGSDFDGFLPGFTGFYRVLLGFAGPPVGRDVAVSLFAWADEGGGRGISDDPSTEDWRSLKSIGIIDRHNRSAFCAVSAVTQRRLRRQKRIASVTFFDLFFGYFFFAWTKTKIYTIGSASVESHFCSKTIDCFQSLSSFPLNGWPFF